MLNKLGFPSHQKKFIRRKAAKIALRSSFFIWSNRFKADWSPPSLAHLPKICNFPPLLTTFLFSLNLHAPTSQQRSTFPLCAPSPFPLMLSFSLLLLPLLIHCLRLPLIVVAKVLLTALPQFLPSLCLLLPRPLRLPSLPRPRPLPPPPIPLLRSLMIMMSPLL